MGSSERLFKNTTSLLISTIIQKTAGLIFTILLARYLGTEGYGQYSFILAFISMIDTSMCYGVDVLMIREIAKERSKGEHILKNVLSFKVFLVPIFISIAFGWFLITDTSQQIKNLVLILAASQIFFSFNKTLCSFFSAYERLEYVALLDITVSLAKTVFILSAIVLDLKLKYIITGISVSYFLVFLIAIIVYRYKFFPFSFKIDWQWLKENLTNSLWFILYVVIFGYYWKVDQLIISDLLPYEKVGIYSAAFLFIDLSIAFSLAYFSSVYPLISRVYHQSNNNFKLLREKSYKFFLIIGIPIPFMGLFIGDELVKLIYGTSFSETANVVKVFLFVIPVIFLKSFLMRIAFSSGKERPLFFVTAAVVVTKILLNYFCLNIFGFMSAPFVMIFAAILYVYLISVYCVSCEDFVFSRIISYACKPLLSAGIMVFILSFVQHNSIFLITPLGIFIYGISLIYLKAIDSDEWLIVATGFKRLLVNRN